MLPHSHEVLPNAVLFRILKTPNSKPDSKPGLDWLHVAGDGIGCMLQVMVLFRFIQAKDVFEATRHL